MEGGSSQLCTFSYFTGHSTPIVFSWLLQGLTFKVCCKHHLLSWHEMMMYQIIFYKVLKFPLVVSLNFVMRHFLADIFHFSNIKDIIYSNNKKYSTILLLSTKITFISKEMLELSRKIFFCCINISLCTQKSLQIACR